MQVAQNKVVTIHYTLKDESGTVIEEMPKGEGFPYLHGCNNIVPGLENALSDKAVGDSLSVDVSAEEGYGQRDDNMVQEVPKDLFSDTDLQMGAQYFADGPGGEQIAVTVTKIDDDTVTVDGNPPLAGQPLHFDVEILSIRDATAEELEHGHAHGPDGHQHHD